MYPEIVIPPLSDGADQLSETEPTPLAIVVKLLGNPGGPLGVADLVTPRPVPVELVAETLIVTCTPFVRPVIVAVRVSLAPRVLARVQVEPKSVEYSTR